MPASGAFNGMKGDGRVGQFFEEYKSTKNRSFRLKLDDLEKMERECAALLPCMQIEFISGDSHRMRHYRIVPEWVFDRLRERMQ